MRFAHIADVHLGGWRQPELQQLNLESFRKSIDICIEEKVDFIVFAGDLFDLAYPPIEILKETFAEFKRIKESGIKCFIIAGSHDYSVSGKTFLDVLEKAGFCEGCQHETETDGQILLKPIQYRGFSIYGYPGKKSGLEVPDLKKVRINEDNNFKILMLHTTVTEAKGSLPIDSVDLSSLPKADYYAMGHLHMNFQHEVNSKPALYSGPLFPNNFQELEELGAGSFFIVDVNGFTKLTKKIIKIREIINIEIEIENALTGTEKILSELSTKDLKDKIILLKLKGTLKQGKHSDIRFPEIQDYIEKKEAYVLLKNTSKLKSEEAELQMEMQTDDINEVEETIIDNYKKENTSKFNELITPLLHSLDLEKQDDEKSAIFESRLFAELNKVLNLEIS